MPRDETRGGRVRCPPRAGRRRARASSARPPSPGAPGRGPGHPRRPGGRGRRRWKAASSTIAGGDGGGNHRSPGLQDEGGLPAREAQRVDASVVASHDGAASRSGTPRSRPRRRARGVQSRVPVFELDRHHAALEVAHHGRSASHRRCGPHPLSERERPHEGALLRLDRVDGPVVAADQDARARPRGRGEDGAELALPERACPWRRRGRGARPRPSPPRPRPPRARPPPAARSGRACRASPARRRGPFPPPRPGARRRRCRRRADPRRARGRTRWRSPPCARERRRPLPRSSQTRRPSAARDRHPSRRENGRGDDRPERRVPERYEAGSAGRSGPEPGALRAAAEGRPGGARRGSERSADSRASAADEAFGKRLSGDRGERGFEPPSSGVRELSSAWRGTVEPPGDLRRRLREERMDERAHLEHGGAGVFGAASVEPRPALHHRDRRRLDLGEARRALRMGPGQLAEELAAPA